MGVLDVIGGGLKVAGAGINAYGEEKRDRVAQLIKQQAAERQAENDRVLNTLRGAQATALTAPKPPRTELVGNQVVDLDHATAKPVDGMVAPPVKHNRQLENGQIVDMDEGTATPVAGYKAPAPTTSFSPVVTTTPGGDQHVSLVDTKNGTIKDTGVGAKQGAPSIPAALRAKVAENQSTLATIDEALKSLDTHEDAVGLGRNAPLVGKYLDQRIDPEGVGTRALIANVGSLQIHTRTGANMNIREEPRLAPFVPDASDTPEAIRTKLQQLQKFLKLETDGIISGPTLTPTAAPDSPASGGALHPAASREQQLWDAAVAKYGEARVRQEYGARPPK